jgi:hypothetical protein
MMFLVAIIVDRSRLIPQLCNPCFNVTMHAVLISCRFLLATLGAMLDRVRVRDNLYLQWPAFASQAVAKRLATGLRHVEAYLRRVLLVMALELEPTLVDVPRSAGRSQRRNAKAKGKAAPHFCILPKELPPSFAMLQAFEKRKESLTNKGIRDPQPVPMARLYERLDHLAAIVNDPLKRANRLAFHLARKKEGPILARNQMLRLPGFWGTEVRATFDALAFDIITRSKKRPPPLQPPRRFGPSATSLE